jgi:hypothetical protein
LNRVVNVGQIISKLCFKESLFNDLVLADSLTRNNLPSKDDSGQVWLKLAQWFQRRRFLKKFTDGRQVMAIAHTGELKMLWPRQENTIQKTIISSTKYSPPSTR